MRCATRAKVKRNARSFDGSFYNYFVLKHRTGEIARQACLVVRETARIILIFIFFHRCWFSWATSHVRSWLRKTLFGLRILARYGAKQGVTAVQVVKSEDLARVAASPQGS